MLNIGVTEAKNAVSVKSLECLEEYKTARPPRYLPLVSLLGAVGPRERAGEPDSPGCGSVVREGF